MKTDGDTAAAEGAPEPVAPHDATSAAAGPIQAMAEIPKAPDTAATEPEPEKIVPAIQRHRLVRPHGFINQDGRHCYWTAGDVVSDPAEVAMLKGRGASLEPID
jgi:hypothetical protein